MHPHESWHIRSATFSTYFFEQWHIANRLKNDDNQQKSAYYHHKEGIMTNISMNEKIINVLRKITY
jgi:hypothetical protein